MFEDDEFDALLRSALAQKPEPKSDVDLAARVLAVAAPRRTASVWPVVIAAVAMAVVVAFGMQRLAAIEQSLASLTASSATATTSADALALLPAGGIGLLVVLVWLTARSAFERNDAYFLSQ